MKPHATRSFLTQPQNNNTNKTNNNNNKPPSPTFAPLPTHPHLCLGRAVRFPLRCHSDLPNRKTRIAGEREKRQQPGRQTCQRSPEKVGRGEPTPAATASSPAHLASEDSGSDGRGCYPPCLQGCSQHRKQREVSRERKKGKGSETSESCGGRGFQCVINHRLFYPMKTQYSSN